METATALPPVCEPKGIWADVPDGPPFTWLWDGFLATGNITLLTSRWKSGKTTLLSLLLARLRSGGTLAGQAVGAAPAIVLTEEGREHWKRRCRSLALEHVFFLGQLYRGKPTPKAWTDLITTAGGYLKGGGGLVVVDSLGNFLPAHSETSADGALQALMPLRKLTERGIAVLLLHHPPKKAAAPGCAARGSGALAAFTDINLEMAGISLDPADRRRRLTAFSRFDETPRQLLLELDAAGLDYALVAEAAESDGFEENWECLRTVLEDADDKKTVIALRDEWPAEFEPPSPATLHRWLTHVVDAGHVRREGTGRRAAPFRYWLPEREAVWQKDPMYRLLQAIEESNRRSAVPPATEPSLREAPKSIDPARPE